MYVTRRRTVLALAGTLAAGTVAAVALLRKPAVLPEVHMPLTAPETEGVKLQSLDALKRTDPPAPPPPIEFTDGSGKVHTLADFAGKGVVLNLWATWCLPCVAELPALAALSRRMADGGVVVIPLSSDRGGAPAVEKYMAEHGIIGLSVWLDPKSAAAHALGARGIPTTLIIDREGRERGRVEGAVDWASDASVATIRTLIR
jgi:thiol-disulfide isomerase/thioredoxin